MKANELMTGDYFRIAQTGKIIKIVAVDECSGSVDYFDGDAGGMLTIGVEKIEAIPLTAEILEKNGWKKEFDKVDYMVKYDLAKEGKHCWMMWAIKEHNLDIQRQDEKLDMYNLKVQKVCMPCDFVHQLQHALRLCGIDKEIVL